MKLQQLVSVLGFLAVGASASPGGYGDKYDYGNKCKKYEWDLERCDWCPYKPYHPRDLDGLEPRGGYGYPKTCKRKCPSWKKKCKKYDWDYSKPYYSTWFDDYTHCPRGDSYKVVGKIIDCPDWKYGKGQCLYVEYEDWDKWSDKKAYLGIYKDKKYGPKKKEDLNYNSYCYKNKCLVPLDKLKGYGSLCDKKFYVGIDDDQCKRKDYGYPHGGKKKGGKKYGDDYGDKKGGKKYGDDYGDKKDDYDDKKGGKKYGDDYGDGGKDYGDDGKDYGDDYGDDYDDDYGDGYGDDYGTDGYGGGYGHEVEYIEIDIKCKYPKKCTKYCCCA